MRRAHLSKAMDVQQKNFLQAHLENSQFAQKLLGLPMFKAAVCTAGDAYVKVKESNALVRRSIELTLNISTAVAEKLTPLAERGMYAASGITTRVDSFAAAGLDGLIAQVPFINEEPNEIVQNTRSAIEKRVTVINGYTESVLKTWPVQSAMDMYEAILNTANNTLDNVLPPAKDEDAGKPGLVPVGEQEKHKRGIILVQRTYHMFSTAFRRVFGICQTQVENAASATDNVYKHVRNAVGDTTTTSTTTSPSTEANNVTNNGDANKQSANKKGKKKNNASE